MASFFNKLNQSIQQNNSLLCIGLDSNFEKIPECLKNGKGDGEGEEFSSRQRAEVVLEFNHAIVDATKDLVCAYKPNSAFYEALGSRGIEILKLTVDYIHENAPDVPVIVDAKRADIGSTNNQYVDFIFEYLQADAVTVHPYLGREALLPFLDQKEKGIFVLCRTSNKGAGEFQDIKSEDKELLYKKVAKRVVMEWNFNDNCGLVVGASPRFRSGLPRHYSGKAGEAGTYPEELKEVREIAPDMPLLVPGIGAQGGDVEKTVNAGIDSNGKGMIINSSRGIIFASGGEDFADVARAKAQELRDEINKHL